MIRWSAPGTYRVECASGVPMTFRLSIHTNWGRQDQTTRTVTLFTASKEPSTIAEVDFEFQVAD